jgi:protein O-mannosyl-transferase
MSLAPLSPNLPALQSPAVYSAHRARAWGAGFILVLLTFAVYQPAWYAGFIWDDDLMLTHNPVIHAPEGLLAIWFSTQLPDYFPFTSSTLWLEWRLWGENAACYHLVNIALHAISAVLWWRVLLLLRVPGAWIAAALFAVHPVAVESVAWITERKNTLAMVFMALTCLSFLHHERTGSRRWYGLSLLSFVAALLSKTAVVPLPAVFATYYWWRHGRLTRRDVMRLLPFVLASVALALVTLWFHQYRALGDLVVREDTFWSRLTLAASAVWFYLGKIVWPGGLAFIYPRSVVETPLSPAWLPLLLLALGGLLLWRLRTVIGRGPLFAAAAFVLLLGPILGFVDITFMRFALVADRWQYFAFLVPIALLVAGCARVTTQWPSSRPLLQGAAGLAVLICGTLTWRQAHAYQSLESLWSHTVAHNPAAAVAQTELGNVRLKQERWAEAFVHYEQAVRSDPKYELAHYNLGYAHLQAGDLSAGIGSLRRTVDLHPRFAPAQFQLGVALLTANQPAAAVPHLETAVQLEPTWSDAHDRLAQAWLHLGEPSRAHEHLTLALTLAPPSPATLNNLALASLQLGREDEAAAAFAAILELDARFVPALHNLGRLELQRGNLPAAVDHFQAALQHDPDDQTLLCQLAWVLATSPEVELRDGSRALQLAHRAAKLDVDFNPVVRLTLAAAQAETGDFTAAVETAHAARELSAARGQTDLVELLDAHLARYRDGQAAADPATVRRHAL